MSNILSNDLYRKCLIKEDAFNELEDKCKLSKKHDSIEKRRLI